MKKFIDIKIVKTLAIFYGLFVLILLFRVVYIEYSQKGTPLNEINWYNYIIKVVILDWAIVVSYMALISILTKILFIKKTNLNFTLLFHFFFSFLIGWVMFCANSLILYLFDMNSYTSIAINMDSLFNYVIRYIDYNFIIYFVMAGIIYIHHFSNEMIKIQEKKATIQIQLAESKVNILKYKLQPHFLFNTLNNITTLINVDPDLAQNTLIDFSDFLRDLINLKDDNLIPLYLEIRLLKKYLSIMTIRYHNPISISMNIDKNLDKSLIPSMILQPILENVFQHGFKNDVSGLKIKIDITKNKNNLIIVINNNGEKINSSILLESINKGKGISNLNERFKVLYDKFEFSTYNSEFGVTTKIVIPDQLR